MKTLISAVTAASLLLGAVPALADRDERHHNNDHRRQFVQQQRDRRDEWRAERREQYRENKREERREDRREARREDRRDDRRDHRRGKDDHKFVKYVGYDPRYDRNRHGHHDRGHGHGHDRGHGHGYHKPHRPVHLPHKHRWRPAHYGYGYRWTRLPRTYVSLSFGGLGYYFSEGIFYRPYGAGYVVAQAPVGAFVQALPGTAVNVSFNGLSYYVAYDTYYRWDDHRRGYLVVPNPGFL
ncbi:hypothetical protein GNX18_15400 [Microbulbifer sp. SH-1]|uniref:DUF6515 family protein n=1 Tax=Microbulbifer sp. SH-1 TaxID=2681547 RepID=UPI00140BBD55|nr:DUF6515 family protein [Microbulbifer sp. SH-1]QIL91003.1 hypothetical protein GNX18_15400 [Microbulbifer sp. SH-1]